MSYSSREPGATARYSCNNQGDNFTLIGTTTRNCTKVSENEARWSGEEPKCKKQLCWGIIIYQLHNQRINPVGVPLCPIPRLPTGEVYAKGIVTYLNRKPGDIARYTCERYAELVGPERRTCLEDGTWSGINPYCRRKKQCKLYNTCSYNNMKGQEVKYCDPQI